MLVTIRRIGSSKGINDGQGISFVYSLVLGKINKKMQEDRINE